MNPNGDIPQPGEPFYSELWYRIEPAPCWGFYVQRGRGLLVRSPLPAWRPTRQWAERLGRCHLRRESASAAREAQAYTVTASDIGGPTDG